MNKAFLISPSGFSELKNLKKAKKILKKLNFSVEYKENVLSKYLFYAGNFKRRTEEINEAYSSSAEVIFSLIGGGGAVHTLNYLDFEKIKKSNKVLVGLSDITILLNAIYQKTGARCIHSMNIGKTHKFHRKTIKSFLDALYKKNYFIKIKENQILNQGYSQAKIVGGNLELLGRALGTGFDIDTKGKIVFIEDYDMKSWRIFDILWQLKLAGKFDDVKGIILGNFIKCGNDIGIYLREFFKDFKCSVIINQEIGHGEPNLAIPIGEECVIDTKNKYWGITFSKQ